MSITLLLAAGAASAASPAPLKTFTDWTIGCDNGRACQAVGLLPEDFAEGWTTMVISRDADRAAAPVVRIILNDVAPPTAFAADGKRLMVQPRKGDGDISVANADVAGLIAAMKGARELQLLDGNGRAMLKVSLAGLNAALLYTDEQQKRIGTVTALVRKGPRPASAVPLPPALPEIVSPPVPATPAVPMRKAALAAVTRQLECTGDDAGFDPEFIRLDSRTSLALIPWPCGNGAYNYMTSVRLVDARGKARMAAFDAPSGFGEDEKDPVLVNAGWDPEARTITTYAKGRGLGDCGVSQSFAWDGARFRLVEESSMSECRGSVDYITTWRARVRRR